MRSRMISISNCSFVFTTLKGIPKIPSRVCIRLHVQASNGKLCTTNWCKDLVAFNFLSPTKKKKKKEKWDALTAGYFVNDTAVFAMKNMS